METIFAKNFGRNYEKKNTEGPHLSGHEIRVSRTVRGPRKPPLACTA
jgi:hypothetical protein